MSGTAPTPTTRNALIEDAKGLPDLIEKAKVADPQLADFLLGKSLIASKTPWGVLAGSGIGFLATHYGLACAANSVATNCWTPEDINLAGGFAAMAGAFIGSYIMRYVTSAPISGLFSRGTTP